MNKEKLDQVLQVLSKYDDSKDVIDYYQLFDFDRNMDIEEIQTQIKQKRLQVLFHDDQIKFIPPEHHEKYNKMREIVKDVINAFSSNSSRNLYDKKLDDYNRNSNSFDNADNASDYEKTEDLDEVRFQQSIIQNSEKYGFDWTREAIKELIRNNSARGFTRDNNIRDNIENIDHGKLMKFMADHSLNDDNPSLEQIIMNYLTDLVLEHTESSMKIKYIENACKVNIIKYDLNGYYGQTTRALTEYCRSGNASGFTSQNNARSNLITNVKFNDASFFIQCILNNRRFENHNYAYQSIQTLGVEQLNNIYCNLVVQKFNNSTYNSDYTESYNR